MDSAYLRKKADEILQQSKNDVQYAITASYMTRFIEHCEKYFKETGKDVTATARVKAVKYYELTPEIVEDIRKKYGKQIGTDKFADWQSTLHKKYCTLIWIEKVTKILPVSVPRSNGAGWIVVNGK